MTNAQVISRAKALIGTFLQNLPRVRVFRREKRILATLLFLSLLGRPVVSGEPLESAPAVETITDPAQVWAIPTEKRMTAYPLRVEGRVSYFDPLWRHLWLEKNGVGAYMMLSTTPPALRQGSRVLVEGTFVPGKGLDAELVKVKVLRDYESIVPMGVERRIADFTALASRVVTTQAYVDSQQLTDDSHVRLSLIVEDQPVTGWVKPTNPTQVPNWQGSFVRITGLYQGRFDPTQTQMTIEIWTANQADVTVLGPIAEAHRFEIPQTAINELYKVPRSYEVKVRGKVQSHEVGSTMIVRDDTGQVAVQSVQQQRVSVGTEVEAVGRVVLSNARWTLQSALFRKVDNPTNNVKRAAGPTDILESIDQLRQLTAEEAAKGRAVKISGVVTWALPGFDFFFLEDLTGGIRVRFRNVRMEPPPRNKHFEVTGVTYNGGFAAAVDLTEYKDLGTLSTPPVKEITLDRAMTGEEDGQYVDLRGFYQRTESEGDLRKIYITTPAGEFVGLLKSTLNFTATPGSLLRARGVCEAVTDDNGRITGIMLRVPSLAAIAVEENAPADYFNLPLQSIKSLRRLNSTRELTRVRVSGQVIQALPGRSIYLQDQDQGMLLLTHESDPLAPGDQVEAVGILGSEGARIVLREAVYRKQASGLAPAPVPLADPAQLERILDSRLVKVRGTLIDLVRRPERTRLTLQAGNTLFEAILDQPANSPRTIDLALGAGLELTGIYKLSFDDSRQSRSFQIQLRSPDDIHVFQLARVWTLERALILITILGGCTLLGIGWVTALRIRVRRQTEQIRAQLERQAQLEVEVQRATRLESLGVLAGGIAHDFNNLLTIVLGNITLMMLDDQVMELAGNSLRDVEKGAIRARDLTQQLLTFAKGGNPVRSTVSLPNIVRDTTKFILHGSNVCDDHQVSPDLWSANVDKDQIAQVIQNLVLNAMQAMPNGGIVRTSLRNELVAEGEKNPLLAGRYVRLAIADSGEGIKPSILPRIFDPYFSTKKAGSGLGLATVYSIVKKHQGHIEVESTVGKGSTFVLWLPAAESSSAPHSAPASPGAAPSLAGGRPARILLMDDEESIRQLGSALLRKMGHDVTVVADGAEAMRSFLQVREAKRPFDLVILDLTIPGGMGGREVIESIRKMDTKVQAIVSSGYSNDPVLANYGNYGFQAMVAKPYDVSRLATTITEILSRRSK